MKKNTLVALLLVFSFIISPRHLQAQKLFFLFAHGLYATPVDSYFKNNYNYGLGIEGGAGVGTGNTFLVGTIGYTFFSNASGSKYGNTFYYPIKVGLRHYLLVGKILFFNVDAGVGYIKNNIVNSSRFTGDIGLGVKLGPVEVMGDYDGFTRTSGENSGYSSWIGIKAGVRFGL